LEMDTYRVRTDLTRLEVALESIKNRGPRLVADETVEFDSSSPSDYGFGSINSLPPVVDPLLSVPAAPSDLEEVFDSSPLNESSCARGIDSPVNECEASSAEESPDHFSSIRKPNSLRFKLATQPVFASLVLHGAMLLAIVSVTVAAVVHHEAPFTTTVLDLGEKTPERADNFDLGQLAPLDVDNVGGSLDTAEPLQADSIPSLERAVVPVDFESAAVGPPNEGQEGLTGPPPTEDGTMPTGEGGTNPNGVGKPGGSGGGQKKGGSGNGRGGGTAGSALFFGTQTKGDRFVFVLDNSSSMKNGRFEMAIAELVRTVEGLSPRQSFYVIFVSDQPYPMFYPQTEPQLIPATTQNKTRLREWLPKAILASGHNREMIKAMDIAASLRPQAVYLLWDGDLKYSDAVRLDVMTHLTTTPWNFVVHTIGLGITSLDGEQNLTVIAQAHHGVYRRVEVPKVRSR
jgi:hypothetical protein